MENRYLASRPEMTPKSLVSNQYTQKYETFTNDQFLLRDGWITLKSVAESALGKVENNGIVYGSDGYMFEKMTEFNELQLEKNTGYVVEFAEKFPELPVTLMVVPSAYEILPDKLPQGLNPVNQLAQCDFVYARVQDAGVRGYDAAAVLSAHADEYIYYRTDHHWTTYGAYLTANAYLEALGRDSLPPLDTLSAHEVTDFYGTHYSKCKLFSAVPDVITWYDIPVAEMTVDGERKDSLYDAEKFSERDKYAAFLHGNNALTVLRSDRYEQAEQPSRILVMKDSYGNSFAPFLLYSFDEVVVLDLRYFSDLEAYLSENKFDEALILYSFSSFSQDTNISKLRH